MSELTPCNYCTLQDIRRAARKRKARVTVKDGDGDWRGWLVVCVSDEPKPIAYFKALTDHCVC